jgi:hypothetical protein
MNKILLIITAISLTAAALSLYFFDDERNRRMAAETNLSVNTTQYEDKLGRMVTETQELRLSVRQFKQIVKQDSIYMNQYEKDLLRAYETIKAQDKKIRQVESINQILMQSSGTTNTIYQVNDTCKLTSIAPIHTKHFDASFKILNDSAVSVNHSYHTGIDIIVDRDRARDPDGSKRFIMCRLLFPRWIYSASAVPEDTAATITKNVYIRFK